jgi:stage II sporulation protein D
MRVKHKQNLAALAAAPALGLALTPSAHAITVSDRAARNNAKQLIISGAGDGHGVGMSQEGALGYALHGYSYQQILAHYYTGTTIGLAPRRTIVRVLIGGAVRRIPLERYVRGVVSAEVPPTWPVAALEAQAVASRTYALTADAGGSRFQVYADSRSQVYLGKAAETPQTNAAVAATAGQVVTYAGRPAITYFFASSGGMTEDVQFAFPGSEPQPWLHGVADPYDQGPLHRWRITMSLAAAGARLGELVRGSLRGIEVLRRGYSPRIVSAELLGSQGKTKVSGQELAELLGMYGTWAYFSVAGPRGVHREPDLSRYNAPVRSEGGGSPAGPPAGAPAQPPPSQDGGSAAVAAERGGDTPTG